MQLNNPLALFWLLVLPFIFLLGWPSRGYDRKREIISLVLRLILCICLILALAGLEVRDWGKSNQLAVVFLLDVSDSMPDETIQSGFNYIQQAVTAMGADDQAALIVFGQEALVEQPMSTRRDLDLLASIPATSQTDLAQAIHLGLALYPPGAARRMVILSDGAVTVGNASEAFQLAAASSVEIVVLPISINPGAEVMVSNVEAPANLRQGDRFDLNVTLEATQTVTVSLQVFADGNLVYEADQSLEEGSQTLSLPLIADQPGFKAFQVKITAPDDQYYQNNSLSSYSQISGPPKVLLVAPPAGTASGSQGEVRPDEFTPLRISLEAAGFQVDVSVPNLLPSELPSLAAYASVVLVDVPARELTGNQMASLQAYVRDLGGGLVTVGGPTSYGVGGYFRTPLEETLPIDMQIKDEQRRPTLAILFIIDHSGSMAETSGGPSKLDLAKEAVIRSIDFLNPMDKVGVITFDDAASWVVDVQEAGDGGSIKNRVASIGIGGGTDILAGVKAMAAVMPGVDAGARHVILLTDGGADPTGIAELVEQLYTQDGITLSTIGLGRDAAPFLPQLAEAGGGRYHFVDNPASIPNIFTEETVMATRAYIIEETFTPEVVSSSPILAGIQTLPQLYGYVGTSSKETAQTILVSHKGDPVMASWRYGLGKAVAFTSDASGRWAKNWLNWDGFSIFWSQAVRSTINDSLPSSVDIQVKNEGSHARIIVDAAGFTSSSASETAPYLNNYDMQANIISPDGSTQTITFSQVAPGRYEAVFLPSSEGIYLLRVTGTSSTPGDQGISEISGWSMEYSPEYRRLRSDPDALVRLAALSGGRIAETNPAQIFKHSLPVPDTYWPAWPVLLALAAMMLPVDIAVRRLVVTRNDIERSVQSLQAWLQSRLMRQPAVAEQHETMRSLFKAKRNAGEQWEKTSIQQRVDKPSTDSSLGELEKKDRKTAEGQVNEPEQIASQANEPAPQSQGRKDARTPVDSSVSALLKSKRSRRNHNSSDE